MPFRWVNPFRSTSRDSNTSTNTIYTQPTLLPVDHSIDHRATAQAATYNQGSHPFALDIEEGTTGDDDEPVVEYHTIRHIPTEYGTAVDHRQWTRENPGQVQAQEQEQAERPALRRGSAYSSIQAMLRRFSWGSSSSSPSPSPASSSPSPSPSDLPPPLELQLSPAPSFLSSGYAGTLDEAPEEDPLAFAKAGEVEVRQGETEQISPAMWDMRLRKKSLRESVGEWFSGLRRGSAEREGVRGMIWD